MKTVLLAGGFGTRISEESHLKPKPMIEIGGMPLLWHIMKIYSTYGFNDFIICCGYKQHIIKEFFYNYLLYCSDVAFDFANNNSFTILANHSEQWNVTVVDTGLNTMTGGRIKRIKKYVGEDPFMLTYGDGVSNVDVDELVTFHKSHGKIATITAVNASQRFGILDVSNSNLITSFREKDNKDGSLINGGFMVINPEIFDYIDDDNTVLEQNTFERLVADKQLVAYHHKGYWGCMDTQRDKEFLEKLWTSGTAPWRIW